MANQRIKTSSQIEDKQESYQKHSQQNAKSETHEKSYIGFYDYFNGVPNSVKYKGDESHWLYVKIIDSIRLHFHTLHNIEGMDRFIRKKFTTLKFDNGHVAFIKFEGEVIPVNFKVKTKDIVDRPETIEVLAPDFKDLHEREYSSDNFEVVYNNSEGSGTLQLLLEQVKQICSAKVDIDNNQLLTRPIMGVKGKASSKSWVDIKNFLESGESVIPLDNIDLNDISFELTEIEDRHESKKSNFLFQMKVLAMFLGINITDLMSSSNEKTELEISEGMLFASNLLMNMYEELEDGIERVNKKFNLDWKVQDWELDNTDELNSNHIEDDVAEGAKDGE